LSGGGRGPPRAGGAGGGWEAVGRGVPQEMAAPPEPLIDKYVSRVELPPKFILPGGTTLSAQLDVARTAIRRAERRTVELKDAGELASDAILVYLNRASDLAFAMARYTDTDDPEVFEGRGG